MTLMTLKETAEYLRVSPQTLYNWKALGKLIPAKFGGLKYVKEELDELVRKNRKL